ncbi:hypothetical protein DNTS_021512 [Danionella cerebrum]|uniref:RHD domain-containing protein n=1 Tax=Danionella cerebrum TaxID=2873325 RepID=A0A553QI59_9TELE|nr:hypothetical protein DNTS_021512 [Danionella translucida]
MSNLYENIDGEDLDFPLLFLYNHPENDLAPNDQATEGCGNTTTNQTSFYGEESQISNDPLKYDQSDLTQSLDHSHFLASLPVALQGNSPRIEITCPDLHHPDHVLTNPVNINRPMLTVPRYDMAYRETHCLSPASSTSSTSWHSDGCSPGTYSPCISPGAAEGGLSGVNEADLCPMIQAIHASGSPNTSPRTSITEDTAFDRRSSSPRPRSASPQGKRTYVQSQSHKNGQEEPVEFYKLPNIVDSMNNFTTVTKPIPTKIVRSNLDFSLYPESQGYLYPSMLEVKKETDVDPYIYRRLPGNWSSPALPGVCSIPVTALPLDWTLPSCKVPYELSIELQPRQHHRAHYETEGSRGAIKASGGGHPIVQLRGYTGTDPLVLQVFIGTADDRNLRPHSFYQVHRITGKSVTTNSHERILDGTKILEVPLEPKDNMRALVDCAGILKLRNADIEMKKRETDVGRKNTRVRLVFRVHIPQPGGQWLSLQRSPHEQPSVEFQDLDHCSVLGGAQMILRGQNFTSESRVIFFEKTHVDLKLWEAEAKVHRDKSTPSLLFLEIPPYRDPNIYRPVRVSFHVLNGKKKCSQDQHFTYTQLAVPQIKMEPAEETQCAVHGCCAPSIQGLSPPSRNLTRDYVMHPAPLYQFGAFPGISHHASGILSSSQASYIGLAPENPYKGHPLSMQASLFPTLDVSELCSSRSEEVPKIPGTSSVQSNANQASISLKQENLDQAFLDEG